MTGQAPLLALVFALLYLLVDLLPDVLLRILPSKVEPEKRVTYSLSVATAFSEAALRHGSREAEIAELNVAVLVHQDVRGLDVTVNDVGRVEELHGKQAVVQDYHHVVGVQLGLLFQVEQIFEISPKVLHDDENAQIFVVLLRLWNYQVEDLRGAIEVDLLLHL